MKASGLQLHIDSLRVIAAQLIVLHHLTVYGPLSVALNEHLPNISYWLFHEARLAVQIFLVVGGYIAAMSLDAGSATWKRPLWVLWLRRYWRLAAPCFVAVLLTCLCTEVARLVMQDNMLSATPTLGQLAGHALLLQNLLGQEALSAGVWYVAIDVQLFALLSLLMWPAAHLKSPLGARLSVLTVLVIMAASLIFFNLDARWDVGALYFFGAYAMGACAYWAGTSARRGKWLALLALLGLGVGLTLAYEFRERIAIALAVALWLGGLLGQRALLQGSKEALPLIGERLIQWGGKTSYALFLVHFAVLTLVNALFAQIPHPSWSGVAACVVLYWLVSMGLAAAFERWIERPLQSPPWMRQK